ncbi:MAG: 23S rRNA (adenine(2503)-C(2))-methyltransferase RlmN, partial [Alphaproteobacteria bacterium]
MTEKTNICGYTKKQLKELMNNIGQKPFRAKQLFHWMYNQGETDFAKMTTLSKEFRSLLADNFSIARPE